MDSSLSPGALRMTGITAARVSFAESSELLRELAELRIDPKQVERTAEALGRAIHRLKTCQSYAIYVRVKMVANV